MNENEYRGSFAFPIPDNVKAALIVAGRRATTAESIDALTAELRSYTQQVLNAAERIGQGTIRNVRAAVMLGDFAMESALSHFYVIDGEEMLVYEDDEHIPNFETTDTDDANTFLIRIAARPAYVITPNGKRRSVVTNERQIIFSSDTVGLTTASPTVATTSSVRIEIGWVNQECNWRDPLYALNVDQMVGVMVNAIGEFIAAGNAQRVTYPFDEE